ncbi:glycoside hydrolase family 3 protein [Colwellia sp. 1_MG-2023]|uniref:glycoside hydrolase family 3 protein n=1 Tax=unclassified Colwellia TaxID=196834 RepID=UPI001C083825|nr:MULTISPECIES: glycoside hydrolase family 3 protein [unclassified Colwellia]MBU2923143.1 glycoside hydrolase family 3 protein [Colwellia sp. C2M11]MDO6651428.1 glycoside hydrolase family 3 protein [Colwellia sp. 3_MG-2023]MDO6664149.1 glycoside hydrolase family 3 protein [Colwellia sp. 2_MG-2023]MDO6688737.1 glycoside hydrolase family 3 protein [Colwellia sp. 1_MG-2023]
MLSRISIKIILSFAVMIVIALSLLGKHQDGRTEIAQKIAQKLMLDIRYYCPELTEHVVFTGDNQCVTPVTTLSKDLAELITDTSLGSVILFAENFTGIEQTIHLTQDLQQAALASASEEPLLISIDQEGGRVVRLPRTMATSFTGNMAIGATYENHGDYYARKVGEVIGAELATLGVNVNHAPDVDVNINPNNPVINVRSFGETPEIVAELGIAMLEGLQSKGVIGTLKHFPGHGDTNTDSHTGLPRVEHPYDVVRSVDLLPFQQAIDRSNVEMIMTAHIQYPALDDSLVVNKFGESMIKPATLSKKILTSLLRDEMGFDGIIITDALDMAGIAEFFSEEEAVLHTFNAGADIAMMPMSIRQPSDIPRFKAFIELLVDKVLSEELSLDDIDSSVERITALKQKLAPAVTATVSTDVSELTTQAKETLGIEKHRALEQALVQHSIVEIKPNPALVKRMSTINNIHLVFPKKSQSEAMALALNQYALNIGGASWSITSSSLDESNSTAMLEQLDNSELVIVANDSQKTAVELGQAGDLALATTLKKSSDKSNADKALDVLAYAKQKQLATIYISLKAPYQLEQFTNTADWVLACFDGNAYQVSGSDEYTGAVFNGLTQIISGQISATGHLPITI